MADNTSGKGIGEGGGYDPRVDPPVRESVSQRPAARRDPRADPDDEPVSSSSRVDVIGVDRTMRDRDPSSADTLTNAALVLRRELAKLHQQAAAVERTIEDQRRERSDALERVEYATQRAAELEAKLEQAEAEATSLRRLHDGALDDLQKVRSERDDLLRAIEAAKASADELSKARSEAETLREAHDEALRAASTYEAELAEIRKREQLGAQKVSDTEAEIGSLRERLERATAELSQAREETTTVKAEVARLRQEGNASTEATNKLREEAERDRASAKEKIERLEKSITDARNETRVAEEKRGALETELTTLRAEVAQARTEIARLERDVEAARHSRDVSAERATMAEKETQGVRKDAERLMRELEAAVIAGAQAHTRAAAAERAKAMVEDSVRQLRDEVTSAFARWRAATPSSPPPSHGGGGGGPAGAGGFESGSVAPPTRAMPQAMQDAHLQHAISPEAASAPPPATKRGEDVHDPRRDASTSFPPVMAEAAPLSMVPSNPPPVIDEEWGSPSATSPSVKPHEKTSEQMPASIPAVLVEDGDIMPASTASPTSRSVPPPLPPTRSRPPPLPPPRTPSIPPAVYPSVAPAGVVSVAPPSSAEPSGVRAIPSEVPPSQVASSQPQDKMKELQERDELLARLHDPNTGRAAAMALRNRAHWLKGRPPVELLEALTRLDYDVEHPIFELARSWDRESLCKSLVGALRNEPDAKLREHNAWLLKHLGSPTALAAIVDTLKNEAEPPPVRRWLLEAIERLVASRSVGLRDVADVIETFVHHPDASLRDGVIGVIAALERSDEKRRLLLELLRTDDDEVVLASAVHALTSALPIELDPAVAERLLGHPSARVQRSVVDFIERSKRAARNATS